MLSFGFRIFCWYQISFFFSSYEECISIISNCYRFEGSAGSKQQQKVQTPKSTKSSSNGTTNPSTTSFSVGRIPVNIMEGKLAEVKVMFL